MNDRYKQINALKVGLSILALIGFISLPVFAQQISHVEARKKGELWQIEVSFDNSIVVNENAKLASNYTLILVKEVRRIEIEVLSKL